MEEEGRGEGEEEDQEFKDVLDCLTPWWIPTQPGLHESLSVKQANNPPLQTKKKQNHNKFSSHKQSCKAYFSDVGVRGMLVTMVTFKYTNILVPNAIYLMTLAYIFETRKSYAVPAFVICMDVLDC